MRICRAMMRLVRVGGRLFIFSITLAFLEDKSLLAAMRGQYLVIIGFRADKNNMGIDPATKYRN